jgi:hypothetical protein
MSRPFVSATILSDDYFQPSSDGKRIPRQLKPACLPLQPRPGGPFYRRTSNLLSIEALQKVLTLKKVEHYHQQVFFRTCSSIAEHELGKFET